MIYAIKLADGATVIRADFEPNEEEVIVDSIVLSAVPSRTQRVCWEDRVVRNLRDDDTETSYLEARLLADIEARRILLSEMATDIDPAKRIEYLRKGAEALSDVGPWPWLQTLATARGTSLTEERKRVIIAMASDDLELRLIAISATAHAAKDAIMNAATAVDKVASYEAVVWPA